MTQPPAVRIGIELRLLPTGERHQVATAALETPSGSAVAHVLRQLADEFERSDWPAPSAHRTPRGGVS